MDLEMDAEIELETIKQIRHCELGEYSQVSKKKATMEGASVALAS